jgi:hypothetical protein
MKKVVPVRIEKYDCADSILSTILTDKDMIVGIEKCGESRVMVRKESEGFITRYYKMGSEFHQSCGSSGHHKTINDCILHDSAYHNFFVI